MPRFFKKERLLSRKEYERVRNLGVKSGTKALLISCVLGEKTRLGIVVTSKVGVAVERNRIKRVVREHFRMNKAEYPPGDCVVVMRNIAGKLDNYEIRNHLEQALGKLKKQLKGK